MLFEEEYGYVPGLTYIYVINKTYLGRRTEPPPGITTSVPSIFLPLVGHTPSFLSWRRLASLLKGKQMFETCKFKETVARYF